MAANYVKTTWRNRSTKLNAANMNKIETGIADNSVALADLADELVQVEAVVDSKQSKLIPGENIKTIGGQSLLGSGDIPAIQGEKGDKGDKGDRGDVGPAGPQGAPGLPVTITIDKTTYTQTGGDINLTHGVVKSVNGKPGAVVLSGADIKTNAQSQRTVSEDMEAVQETLGQKADVAAVEAKLDKQRTPNTVYGVDESGDPKQYPVAGYAPNAIVKFNDGGRLSSNSLSSTAVEAPTGNERIVITKQSLNNKTGFLANLTTTNKTNLVAAINEVAAGGGGGGGAVDSVNGQTGTVVLTADDINATNAQSIQANLERIDERIDAIPKVEGTDDGIHWTSLTIDDTARLIPVGEKGDKGDKGDPGEKGDKGDPGDPVTITIEGTPYTPVDGNIDLPGDRVKSVAGKTGEVILNASDITANADTTVAERLSEIQETLSQKADLLALDDKVDKSDVSGYSADAIVKFNSATRLSSNPLMQSAVEDRSNNNNLIVITKKSLNDKTGFLADLETADKSNLVAAINEVNAARIPETIVKDVYLHKNAITGDVEWASVSTGSASFANLQGSPEDNVNLKAALDAKQPLITTEAPINVAVISGLATVATSGSYTDLSNRPTIPTVDVTKEYVDQGFTRVDQELAEKVDLEEGKELVEIDKVAAYDSHIENALAHVSAEDRASWSGKPSITVSGTSLCIE